MTSQSNPMTQGALFDTGRQLRRIRIRHSTNEQNSTESSEGEFPGSDESAADGNLAAIEVTGVDAIERVRIDVSGEPAVFEVEGLLSWPSTARVNFFRLVADLPAGFQLRADAQGEEFADPFGFVLSQLVDASDVRRCQAGRDAAVEAAVVFHTSALGPACNRILGRLRELGVRGVRIGDILHEARECANRLPFALPQPQPQLVRITDALPGCIAPVDLVVPPGWVLSRGGIVGNDGRVLSVPVLICAQLRTDDDEFLEIMFERDGNWTTHVVPREKIATPRGLLQLTRLGLPVNATNAKSLVKFFAAFEEANQHVLPARRGVDHLGWSRDGERDVFVLSEDTTIACEDPNADEGATDDAQTTSSPARIVFQPQTPGERELAQSIRTAGSYTAWLESIAPIAPYPRAKLLLYVSLTPPLLPIFGAPSFCVDVSGRTSCGKTTLLRLAASCWGCPNDGQHSFLLTWDSTAAYRQGAAQLLQHLPLMIDETRLAGSSDEVVDAIYSIVAGQGRGRGSRDGLQRRDGFTTALILSSELPLIEMTSKDGARARTFSLCGSPFGGTDQTTAAVVGELNRGLATNFGFAGPALVRHLARYRGMWPAWREEYEARVRELEQRAGNNPVACRMARPLAAISCAGRLCHQAMPELPWRFVDVVEELWSELTQHAADADRAAAALEYAMDWARLNRDRFFRESGPRRPRSGNWVGRWDVDGTFIGFIPDELCRVLSRGGFEFEATVRVWRDRGWILRDASSGKARHRVRIDGELCWVIAIRREAIDGVDGQPRLASVDNGDPLEGGTT